MDLTARAPPKWLPTPPGTSSCSNQKQGPSKAVPIYIVLAGSLSQQWSPFTVTLLHQSWQAPEPHSKGAPTCQKPTDGAATLSFQGPALHTRELVTVVTRPHRQLLQGQPHIIMALQQVWPCYNRRTNTVHTGTPPGSPGSGDWGNKLLDPQDMFYTKPLF